MKQIDSDQSGQIDYTEFFAASLDRKHYENERLCWAAFKVFDRNNDGVISKQELAEVLNNGDLASQVGKELIEKIMADADTNGDGEIDFNEFMAMMKKDSEGIADIAA